jgi:hypothetical protein
VEATPENWSPFGSPATGDALVFTPAYQSGYTADLAADVTLAGLTFTGNYVVTGSVNPVRLGGPLRSQNGGAVGVGAALVLAFGQHAAGANSSGVLQLKGAIGGAGGLAFDVDPTSRVTVEGESDSTYAGSTVVAGGGLVSLARSPGHVAVPGALTVTGGVVSLEGDEQVADSAPVAVAFDGELDLTFGRIETIGPLTSSGIVDLGARIGSSGLRTGAVVLDGSSVLAAVVDQAGSAALRATGAVHVGGELWATATRTLQPD